MRIRDAEGHAPLARKPPELESMRRFRLTATFAWMPILLGAILANALDGAAQLVVAAVVFAIAGLQFVAARRAVTLRRQLV